MAVETISTAGNHDDEKQQTERWFSNPEDAVNNLRVHKAAEAVLKMPYDDLLTQSYENDADSGLRMLDEGQLPIATEALKDGRTYEPSDINARLGDLDEEIKDLQESLEVPNIAGDHWQLRMQLEAALKEKSDLLAEIQ